MKTRPSQCFECETGTYKDVTVNYFSQLNDGKGVILVALKSLIQEHHKW